MDCLFDQPGNGVIKPQNRGQLHFCFYVAVLIVLGCALYAREPMSQDPLARFGFPEGTVLRRGRYALAFNGATRCPRWVIERLDLATMNGTASREGLNFRADTSIPKEFRPTTRDFAEPVYDIGHMAAANDFGDQDDSAATFVLSNACPQTAEFNRGIWRQLETEVRRIAETAEVWVVTAPVWNPAELRLPRSMGSLPIHVAPAFGKAILIQRDGVTTLRAWIIPHFSEGRKTLDAYRVTTDEFEKRVGVDVWTGLNGAEKLEVRQ